jgi:DNA-binding PadR family transcriptional regulator
MYRDNSLVPTEAVRLCALGELARGDKRYADLATAVRHFVGRVVGPSLDLLGPSLELLRLEGLIAAVDGRGMADNARLTLTPSGRSALKGLLTARVKAQVNDLNKLVVALKMRFFDLLERDERQAEADRLIELHRGELVRLNDLKTAYAQEAPHLAAWLDFEIGQIEVRLAWWQERLERF